MVPHMAEIVNSPLELQFFEYTSDRARMQLSDDEVHLWVGHCDINPGDLRSLEDVLSPDERERRERFHFDADRSSFLFARTMLRTVLGRYLGRPPAEVRFAYSAYGKPEIAGQNSIDLHFNLSHSAGKNLLAVCRGRRIGVDVEQIRRDFDAHEISRRFFSPAERLALSQIPEGSCHEAFFHCWTRKEAFVKARGEGLSCPLEDFDVSVDPRDEQVSLTVRPDAGEAERWTLQSVKLFPDYAAAIAVEKRSEEPD